MSAMAVQVTPRQLDDISELECRFKVLSLVKFLRLDS